jgi:O-antigen biosynthesis protein WbqV
LRLLAFAFDLALAELALVLALLLRHGSLHAIDFDSLVFGGILPFGLATAASLLVMRTYRTSWRHASTADLVNIFYTVLLAVLIYLPLSFTITRLSLIPRGSVILVSMVMFLMMTGSRVGYRLFKEGRLFFTRRPMSIGQVPILIVGGGVDADIFLRSLDRASHYYPVGLLDEGAQGSLLRGVPVLGAIASAARVIESFDDAGDRPRKLVIVNRTLAPEVLGDLLTVANRYGLTVARGPDPTRLQPGMSDTLELQPISVEDLLGRSQVVLDPEPVNRLIAGKRILVTGAGGSIGTEIVRQVCAIGPAAICLVDSSEFNLYKVDSEVAELLPKLERISRVIDVRHKISVKSCFAAFRPDIVFHAAALKHVPMVEENPLEGIWTNTVGSRHVCDAALSVGCHAMVLISTDKAVNPANIMGASKRCAEGYAQSLALAHAHETNSTRFVAVRFGNVLGSTGSVVPLFERQLKAGGPLTVTHPDIARYFMTIREAVQLVLQASALGAEHDNMAGRVFVLDMGRPVKIADLARQMIRLAGLEPDKDILIRYSGLRAGEKLNEELFHESEQIETTTVPRVNVAAPRSQSLSQYGEVLERMEQVCAAGLQDEAIGALMELVPEFRSAGAPRSSDPDIRSIQVKNPANDTRSPRFRVYSHTLKD